MLEGGIGLGENDCFGIKMEMGIWGNLQMIRIVDLFCESWKENLVLLC